MGNRPLQEDMDERAMDLALNYLSGRDRSELEMRRYLSRKGCGEEKIEEVIGRLRSYGYLNDEKYARMLVESGAGSKALGRRAIAQKLYQRGIHRDTAQTALEAVGSETERENALLWARRLAPKLAEEEPLKRRAKLSRRLQGKGFGMDAILYALRAVEGESEIYGESGDMFDGD